MSLDTHPETEDRTRSASAFSIVLSGDDKQARQLHDTQLEQDPRWQATLRILASESFAKSSRLSAFLAYVAERSLRGKEQEVTEQQIGIHVFGRPADYNPGEDNIVRQAARQLRQRLALYYREEGRFETIQISIPRGAYVTQFHTAPPTFADTQKEQCPESAPLTDVAGSSNIEGKEAPQTNLIEGNYVGSTTENQFRSFLKLWQRPALWMGLGLLLGATLGLVAVSLHQELRHSLTASDRFWGTLLNQHQRTLVVLGDAGLNMYTNVAGREVDIEEYVNQNYLHTPEAEAPAGVTWAPFAARRYIALSDLTLVSKLLEFNSVNTERVDLRFARDIHFGDFENSNAILIGGPNYNPWVHVFDKNTDLMMSYDGRRNEVTILNRAPTTGEKSIYTHLPLDPNRTGYASISLVDNVQARGKVLLIEGTGMGGVAAAIDFLFNPELMDPIVRRLQVRNRHMANFDLLLETTFYTGGTLGSKVVVFHVHK